ncbi:MAG: glycoside hydrolase family 3 C-terminal domain-containing protein [Candidatus Izemoplasmatales bacterium]
MDLERIFEQLTPAEKATLLTGKKNWWLNGVPRLGIRDFMVGDGPHGLRAYKDPGERDGHPVTRMPATAFPSASLLSSTWNADLIERVGAVIGAECNHYRVDVILGPGVDGKRSPLGGRNFEYYSEDPFLSGKIGAAFVRGVQSTGVGTSVKHFVLNEQETMRRFVSSDVDERTFRELYAAPFETIVHEADPTTIMASYNKIDGCYAAQNRRLLEDVLRREWGYRGIVISDWGGVQDKRASVLAGLDVEMPESEWKDAFIRDVVDGKYPMDRIDAAVKRILAVYDRLLANPNHGKPADFAHGHEVAREAAREGIVLLRNEGGILPLDPAADVLVLGSYAKEPRMNGGGSSELKPWKMENPLEAISAYAETTFFDGYEATTEILAAARKAAAVVIFTGTTPAIESEGHDRADMRLPDEQVAFVAAVATVQPRVVVVNASGSAVETAPFDDMVGALIQSWFGGSAAGVPIAEILFGAVNPSGRLSETFPIRVENTPTYPWFPGRGDHAPYREGLFTGYRFYDTFRIPVRYPFGFGLSYTAFAYSDLRASRSTMRNGDVLEVSLSVANVGGRAGKETVQAYVRPLRSAVVRPDRTLRGFAKVALEPGETKRVALTFSDRDFAHWEETAGFVVASGDYEILIGASVEDIRLRTTVRFDSGDVFGDPLTVEHPVRAWLDHPSGGPRLERFMAATRKLDWWEFEDPLGRVIRRIMKENGMDDGEYEKILASLGR